MEARPPQPPACACGERRGSRAEMTSGPADRGDAIASEPVAARPASGPRPRRRKARHRDVTMQLPDLSRHDTTAKLLLHNAAHWGADVALREKDYGIWKVYTWADTRARVEELGARIDGARRRARRRGRDHRPQPAALAVGGAGGAGGRRHLARHLRGRAGEGGRLSARLRRGQARVRRGRGAGGQGSGDRGPAAARCAGSSTTISAACANTRTLDCCTARS